MKLRSLLIVATLAVPGTGLAQTTYSGPVSQVQSPGWNQCAFFKIATNAPCGPGQANQTCTFSGFFSLPVSAAAGTGTVVAFPQDFDLVRDSFTYQQYLNFNTNPGVVACGLPRAGGLFLGKP